MIGLFDSGIGGLTVLQSLQKILPKDEYIYLGDTARLPYGTKSPETIKRYTQQNIAFLKAKGVDTIISACHSASSSILQFKIRESIPLLNVIEPSCRDAMRLSRTKKIGLMATQATVDAGQYAALIGGAFELVPQACPLLVPLVECGWTDDAVTEQIVERYVKPLIAKKVDVIILGCTHFPLLRGVIQKKVGSQIQLVDPGESLALEIQKMGRKPQGPSLAVYLTDNSPHFVSTAERILPEQKLAITQVDL
jgi:glutamate racemase